MAIDDLERESGPGGTYILIDSYDVCVWVPRRGRPEAEVCFATGYEVEAITFTSPAELREAAADLHAKMLRAADVLAEVLGES